MMRMVKTSVYRYNRNIFFWIIIVGMLGAGLYTGIKALSDVNATAYGQFFDGMESPFTYFAFIAVAALFAFKGFSTRSLRNQITYAGSRAKVYFNQALAAMGLVLATCLAQFFAVFLPALVTLPFESVTREAEIGTMAIRFGLFILVCIMQASVLVFLGAVCYKPTRMITAYIIYELISFLLITFLNTSADSILSDLWIHYKHMYAFRALYTLSGSGMTADELWRMLFVVLGMIALWLGLGYAAFRRRKDL